MSAAFKAVAPAVVDAVPSAFAMVGGYSPEAKALFARMSVQPSAQRAALYNSLLVSLKASGVWDRLSAIYVMAAHDAQAARLNLKGATFDLTAVSNPDFLADRGYAGDAAASYLSTGYTLGSSDTAGQNDHALGVWVNTSTADMTAFAEIGISNTLIGARSGGGNLQTRSVAGSSISTAVASALGNSALSRNSSASFDTYKDGVVIASPASTSSTPTAVPFFIGARNNNGVADSFSSRRIASAYIGLSLNSTQMASLHANLGSYLTAVGGA